MHLNFAFTTVQTLWALTFAALLVLLVVLLGRDRARRYPVFSFSIALIALRLLASRMLFGRMDTILSGIIFLVLALIASLTMLAVVVELARKAFAGATPRAWAIGTALLLLVGGAGTVLWGPWPAWSAINGPSTSALLLHLAQVAAQRCYLLADLLAVELCLVVVYAGRRFHAGWHSHTQKLVIGLSVAAFAESAVRGIWQYIATHAVPHSQAEYEHVLGLQDKLYNANSILYIVVLLWWIVWLWRDEADARLALVHGKNKPAATATPELLAPAAPVAETTASEAAAEASSPAPATDETPKSE
jgi:hypothetical protein